jgi:hypothetical protein
VKVCHRAQRITQGGAQAVFVLHDEPQLVRNSMLTGLDVPFPVLIDLERAAYRAWGLARAPWWSVYLDPKVIRHYVQSLRSGERLRSRGRDTLQMGGDFIVGPDGMLAYSRPQRVDDRPAAGALVKELVALAQPRQ